MVQTLWILGGFAVGYLVVKGALAFFNWAEKQDKE
jgi:hypothetical protein